MSSARELVMERDLVAPLLSPWLVPRDVMSLSETSKACLREVRAGLPEINLDGSQLAELEIYRHG